MIGAAHREGVFVSAMLTSSYSESMSLATSLINGTSQMPLVSSPISDNRVTARDCVSNTKADVDGGGLVSKTSDGIDREEVTAVSVVGEDCESESKSGDDLANDGLSAR